MPFSLSPPRLVLALLIAATGCSRRQVVTDQDSGHWLSITQTPALRVALDSVRIQTESLGTSVWLRFDYTATNPPMTDMPPALAPDGVPSSGGLPSPPGKGHRHDHR